MNWHNKHRHFLLPHFSWCLFLQYALMSVQIPLKRSTVSLAQADRDRIYTFRNKYYYSPRYSDDNYEYRHVALPREMLKIIPHDFFSENGTFKILCEEEWRTDLGITQSLGWVHYACHAPEPHILLFRKPKN